MTTIIDTKITDFISGHPWLKLVLTVAVAILGVAKGRNWFAKRYEIK